MNKSLVLAVKLLIISAVAALVLAFTNSVTAPIIKTREAEELATSLAGVYPGGEEFTPVDAAVKDPIVASNPNVSEIYEAKTGGQKTGYVVYAIGKGGYGGDIEFILGVSDDGTITGYKVMKSSETPGLGSRVGEEPFVSSVIGNKTDQAIVSAASPSTDYDVQGISGSTVSVNAVVSGINGAIAAINELK